MSRRQLRKFEALQQLQQKTTHQEESEEEETEIDVAPVARNRFDLLLDESDDNNTDSDNSNKSSCDSDTDNSDKSYDALIDSVTDTGIDSVTDTGIDPDADRDIDPDTDTGIDSVTDTGIDSVTDTGIDPDADTGIDPDTDTGIDPDADRGIDPDTYTFTKHESTKQQSTKKKKIKKRGNGGWRKKEQDLDLDDPAAITAFLEAVDTKMHCEPVPAAATKSNPQCCHLLSVNYEYFRADLELENMFGAGGNNRTQRYGQGNRRGGGANRKVYKLLLNGIPRQQTSRQSELGLGMTLDTEYHEKHSDRRNNGVNVYKFTFTQDYKEYQRKIDRCIMIRDQQGLLELIRMKPNHLDNLLYRIVLLRNNEEVTMSKRIIQEALSELDMAMHPKFQLTDCSCALDYSRKENRGLFVALFYMLVSLEMRRCFRTALEYCKLLMRLSADGDDPLAAVMYVDYFAIKVFELLWFVEYFDSVNAELNLEMLPNFAYSVPLALFYLSQGLGQINCHSSLKKRLTQSTAGVDSQALRTRADELLLKALLNFPELLLKLAASNDIELPEVVKQHQHFSGGQRVPEALELLYQLYVIRMNHYWKEPDVLEWSAGVAAQVASLASASCPTVAAATGARVGSFTHLPTAIQRHALLADLPAVLIHLPQTTIDRHQHNYTDPLPPTPLYTSAGDDNSNDVINSNPGTVTDWLTEYFTTLVSLPDAQGGYDHQHQNPNIAGAMGAVGGAIGAVGGAIGNSATSLRSLLETARNMLDTNAIFQTDSDQEEALEERDEVLRREDDFNEDQDQI